MHENPWLSWGKHTWEPQSPSHLRFLVSGAFSQVLMLGLCAKNCEGLDTFYFCNGQASKSWVNNQELFSCSVAHTLLELAQKIIGIHRNRPWTSNPQKMDQTYSQLAINRGTCEVFQSLGMGSTQISPQRLATAREAHRPAAEHQFHGHVASSIGWYTRFTWFVLVQEYIPIFWSPYPHFHTPWNMRNTPGKTRCIHP